jgi:hypothetical protein
MKLKVLAVSLLVVLLSVVFVPIASATRYHLSLSLARHETRLWVREGCESNKECTGTGVGRCFRNTETNVSCIGAYFYGYGYEEMECNRYIRWGTNSQGVVAFRGYERAHCFYVHE